MQPRSLTASGWCWQQLKDVGPAYLGALYATEPVVPVLGACAQPFSSLLLLQVLERTEKARGGAVEVATTEVKGKQEFAVKNQLLDPLRHVAPAYCQDVLPQRKRLTFSNNGNKRYCHSETEYLSDL